MNLEKFSKDKSSKELSNQLEEAEKKFGEQLAPESVRNELDEMTIDEIRDNYPVRYEQYVKMLRKKESGEGGAEESPHMRQFIAGLNSIEDYIQRHEDGEKILREGQKTIFADLQDFLEQGKRSGYVKAPTGIGKTVLFSQLVEALDLKTIVVVPNTKLVSQTSEEFADFTDIEVGEVYSKAKEFGRQVTVTTYHSLVSKVDSGEFDPDDVDLLVLDEAHRSLGEKRGETISKFDNATKIGFTATLDLVEKSVPDELRHEIHHMDLREACDLGLVSEARNIIVKTDVNLDDVEITSTGNYDESDLERVLNVEKRNRAAAEIYKKNYLGKRTVVNCSSIDHAERVAEEFQKQGIRATAVHSKISEEEREQILGDKDKGIAGELHTGETPVVVNVQQLIEGFNEPRVEVVMNLHLTQSPRIAEQRAGRGLRLDPDNPDKVADIIDFVDDISDHQHRPIIFADIIRGATLTKKRKSEDPGREREEIEKVIYNNEDMEIEGFEVLTEQQEVESLKRGLDEMMPEEPAEVPEGWVKVTDLTDELGVRANTIRRIANGYLDEHPEWSAEYKNSSGNKATHYAPELVEKIRENFKGAPEGWMKAEDIAEEIGFSHTVVRHQYRKYSDTHPEWRKEYRSSAGYKANYYAPEFITKLKKNINDKAPEGWMSADDLADELRVKPSTIRIRVKKYLLYNPDWSENYRTERGQQKTHYAPELVEKIRSDHEVASEGWVKVTDLTDEFNASYNSVQRTASKYLDEHPEWSAKIRPPDGSRKTKCYSPELVEKLRKEYETAPDGWETTKGLADDVAIDESTARYKAQKYLDEHPEWSAKYRAPSGKKVIYYAPELVQKIRKEYKTAPDGWKTATELSDELGVTYGTAKRRAEKHLNKHTEWSEEYRTPSGNKATYYAPELVKKLTEDHN